MFIELKLSIVQVAFLIYIINVHNLYTLIHLVNSIKKYNLQV